MLTRRQVLFGKFGARPADGAKASLPSGASAALRPAFAESCLPAQGVVCRSCGEACEPAAISFRPAPRGVSIPALNGERCTGCGDCVAICPVGALSLVASELFEELPA